MADVQLDYKMNKSEVQNVVAFLQALKGEVPSQYRKKSAGILNYQRAVRIILLRSDS